MSEPDIIEAETVEEKRLTVVKPAALVTVGNKSAAIEELNQIREFIASQLEDEIDFGVIPGTNDKKVLMLPGAQKVNMYFNVRPEYHVEKTELGNGHVEYNVATTLFSRSTGEPVGAGVGSCSSMESKYRWRKGERKCPQCGAGAITKGRAEYGGGWICFEKKGGCKAKFRDGDTAIESQTVGRMENPDIYDLRNTVLKMAKKRSLVDASVGLGCLSQYFTQDLEEREDDDHHEPPPRRAPKTDAGSHPATQTTPIPTPAPKPATTVAPASAPGEGGIVEGTVDDVTAPTEKGKPFKMKLAGDNTLYSTFDTTIAKHIDVALAEKCAVRVTWKPAGKTGQLHQITKFERA